MVKENISLKAENSKLKKALAVSAKEYGALCSKHKELREDYEHLLDVVRIGAKLKPNKKG